MTITPEQKQAIEKAGREPVRVEDSDAKTSHLIIGEDVYRSIQDMVRIEQVAPSLYEVGEFVPLKR